MKRKISDVMTRVVEYVTPETTVQEAASRMKATNIGSFPVCESGCVVGMITDRDLALRVLAEGRDPATTRIEEVMTREVACCEEEDRVDDAVVMMAERQVRRVPVVSDGCRLVGLVTLGKLAETDCGVSGQVLKEVVQPSPSTEA